MQRDILYATGFFEIGDTFYDDKGQLRTVTDVLVCHYIRRGTYKVLYEVDHTGEFKELLMKGFDAAPDMPAKQEAPTKPALRLYDHQKKNTEPSSDGGE